MDQQQRREFLLQFLLGENKRYEGKAIPLSPENQRKLLRALMNLRPPKPVPEEVLAVQDAYLKERLWERGVASLSALLPSPLFPRVALWRGDITTLPVSAIVNAANSALLGCFAPGHHCIDNAIHTYAGMQLRLYCHEYMEKQGYPQPTGVGVLTPAFNLPCEGVIHVVGPIVHGNLTQKDKQALKQSYLSCLGIAQREQMESLAFCCISTGAFHFPPEEAAAIAVHTVLDFLKDSPYPKKVVFNTFTQADDALYRTLLHLPSAP